MSILHVYDTIHQRNITPVAQGDIVIDDVLATNAVDRRRGISLVMPLKGIVDAYSDLIADCRLLEPDQYYYPYNDLHITLFDYIQGSTAYVRDTESDTTFLKLTTDILNGETAYSLDLRGIVFSRQAGLIQGFDQGTTNRIRMKIRSHLQAQRLKNDERYLAELTHVTFCRFRHPLRDPSRLAGFIENHRQTALGTTMIDTIELVEHDWYNRQDKKRIIKVFRLR